jgi:glycosyltransferase involved in cell wall biosynthesis
LFWPTLLARFSTPRQIPLITTIHTYINFVPDYKKWIIRFLDRSSYQLRDNIIIVVSEGALKQYFNFLKIKPYKAYRLYTFVDINVFSSNQKAKPHPEVFKVFTTGTLRYPKNHEYLINAFAKLQHENIELHIFGDGPQRKELEKLIQQTGAKVILKGDVSGMQHLIDDYDLYVMASVFEGFSLSVLEAMAMRIPLLVSDIPSFNEQCSDVAIYFDLDNVDDFVNKIRKLVSDKPLLDKMGEASKQRVIENFTLQHHMAGLRNIYNEALKKQ